MNAGERNYEAIIIGSGMGGSTAAAALAKRGRRVLVLERHTQLGGLTQTFQRGAYTFATGVHYVGGVGDVPGPEGRFGRGLRWLSDGRIAFCPIGSPYDIIRLPGFEFPVESPREAFVARLKASFPGSSGAIDDFFTACARAQRSTTTLFAARAMPAPWRARPLVERRPLAAQSRRVDRRRRAQRRRPPARGPALRALGRLRCAAGAIAVPPCTPRAGQLLRWRVLSVRRAGGLRRGWARPSAPLVASCAPMQGFREIRVRQGRAGGVRLVNGEQIDAPGRLRHGRAQHRGGAPRRRGGSWRRPRSVQAQRLL